MPTSTPLNFYTQLIKDINIQLGTVEDLKIGDADDLRAFIIEIAKDNFKRGSKFGFDYGLSMVTRLKLEPPNES